MKCVILQPSYIPWRGYFHQIAKADLFIFYDDVQYDERGWRNRNRIKTRAGLKWLTIPVQSAKICWGQTAINEVQISSSQDWGKVHFETLRHAYAKAPYFARYRPMFQRWCDSRPLLLADFAIATTVEIARELGILHTRFVRSSAFGCSGSKTERLLGLLQKAGATHYISGPSAQKYLDTELLAAAGISVEWMSYKYPEYPQLFPPFEHSVSVLDLLLNVGPDAGKFIWNTREY